MWLTLLACRSKRYQYRCPRRKRDVLLNDFLAMTMYIRSTAVNGLYTWCCIDTHIYIYICFPSGMWFKYDNIPFARHKSGELQHIILNANGILGNVKGLLVVLRLEWSWEVAGGKTDASSTHDLQSANNAQPAGSNKVYIYIYRLHRQWGGRMRIYVDGRKTFKSVYTPEYKCLPRHTVIQC